MKPIVCPPGGRCASRTLLEGVLAVAAGLVLASLPEPGDTFRGTLAVLPLVVAALRAIERHALEHRAVEHRTVEHRTVEGRGSPVEGRLAAIVLCGLVAVTLVRSRLGLVATDWFLAAGFLLLLGQRTARLVLALRRSLGRRLPRRPPAAFFWLPLVVYLAIQPWSAAHRQPDGDEPYYLLLTHSLAHDLDLDLANNYPADWRRFMKRAIKPQIGDPVGPGGQQFSRHSFLLPLVMAPAYRLAGRAGAMTTMAVLSAALAWMMLRLAGHYAPRQPAHRYPGAALLAYALFAFSPPLLLYSYQIWIEVPAALLLALALDGLATPRRSERLVLDLRTMAAILLPVALLPILKLRFALLAAPLFFLACWRAGPGRRAVKWLALGLGVAAAGLLTSNLMRFGHPLGFYSWGELDLFKHSPGDFARGGVGMFYDTAFGLFPNAPVWLLLLPALGLSLGQLRSGRGIIPRALRALRGCSGRRRRPSRSPRLLVDLTITALPYVLLVAPRIEWYGGWSPPFRYTMVFLPLLAVGLVPLLEHRGRAPLRMLIVGLGATTLVLSVVWVVIPGWTYNFADGRTHLLDQAGVHLGFDVARFFPSTVRPRAATWVWLAGSLLLVPFGLPGAALGSRPRARQRWPSSSGLAVVLLMLAALPLAGRLLPTRVVHLEDGFVGKHLGSVYPPRWILQRPIYTGGWKIPAGGWVAAAITPGGDQVVIKVAARLDNALAPPGQNAEKVFGRLWISASEEPLASFRVSPKWTAKTLGPFDWPRGARLVMRGDEALTSAVIVDRAEMVWQ